MDDDARPSRQEISDTVGPLGWRLILAALHTHVKAPSLTAAAEAASAAATAVGSEGAAHLALDVRTDRVVLRLTDPDIGAVTGRDLRLARTVSDDLAQRGLTTSPALGDEVALPQEVEIAIDALDIPAIRPFWRAVTGYADEPGPFDPEIAVVDPLGRGPTIWFQQMDAPRPQRNRIHLDVTVPHEAAPARIAATLAAGGTLVDDSAAPAFWVLADPEGNEACICTWQARD
jgi:4a-hydroxytetrahydrobiopterin dehydratase